MGYLAVFALEAHIPIRYYVIIIFLKIDMIMRYQPRPFACFVKHPIKIVITSSQQNLDFIFKNLGLFRSKRMLCVIKPLFNAYGAKQKLQKQNKQETTT